MLVESESQIILVVRLVAWDCAWVMTHRKCVIFCVDDEGSGNHEALPEMLVCYQGEVEF